MIDVSDKPLTGRGSRGPCINRRTGWGLWPAEKHFWAIAKEEAAELGVPLPAVFLGQRRQSGMALRARIARGRTWRRLREEGFSLPCIAGPFGFDHTSVLFALRNLDIWESILLEEELEEATAWRNLS